MSAYVRFDHLLKLLDDDSEVVRQAVKQELTGMRRELPQRIETLETPMSAGPSATVTDPPNARFTLRPLVAR